MDVPTNDIIYSMSVKAPSYIAYAANVGVNVMSFDNVFELEKVS